MKKTKVIAAVALAAVILAAMTGIAAAEQMNVYYMGTTNKVTSVDLVPGDPAKQYDLRVSNFANAAGTEHTLTTTVVPGVGGGAAGDIVVEYQESGGPRKQAPYVWTQDAGGGGAETLGFFVKSTGPVGAHYTVVITDTANGISIVYDIGVASVQVTNVPEFATIAVPVAAILGLVLFFNHRKRRKE